MKKIKQRRPTTPSRLSATMATSAMSLVFLAAEQNPLLAQAAPAAETELVDEVVAEEGDLDQAAWDKYFIEGYNYCDALVLAAFWGEATPESAKIRMGNKMLDFGPKEAKSHVREARAQALKKPVEEMPCWYTDGGYTFDDAELLGKYWGMGLESKSKMTRLLVKGKDADIKTALKAAKSGKKKAP